MQRCCEACVRVNGRNFDHLRWTCTLSCCNKNHIPYHLIVLISYFLFTCLFCSCRWRLRTYFPMWNQFPDIFPTSPRNLYDKFWITLYAQKHAHICVCTSCTCRNAFWMRSIFYSKFIYLLLGWLAFYDGSSFSRRTKPKYVVLINFNKWTNFNR